MEEMNTVRIELNADENTALAEAVLFRIEYLSTQPATPERDKQVKNLASICRKALPQTSVFAAQERSALN